MGGGRRDSATRQIRSRVRWIAALAIFGAFSAAALSADAAAAGDSHILYFEPLRLTAPAAQSQHKSSRSRDLQFDAYGRRFVLSLQPNDKLSPLLQSKPGTAAVDLYKGRIDGASGSWVRIAVIEGQLRGMLWDGADLYVVEPVSKLRASLPANAPTDDGVTAIFRLADVVMMPGATSCGADTTAPTSKGSEAYGSLLNELKSAPAVMQAAGAVKRLEISALGDTLFADRFATEAQARAEILLRLNNVDGIFSAQLGVEIQVPSIDIGESLSASTSANSLLDELAALRKRSPNLYSRGLTHMFTGRDLDGSTVGIAYVDSLCDRQFGVGLSEVTGRGSWVESLVAAHEIGHNFGAVHDGDQAKACASTPVGQFLMSPSINGSSDFSSCSLGLMQPNIPAASCITNLPAADIAVAASLGVIQRPVGRAFEWDLTVLNSGGVATANARAEILLPPVLLIEDAYVVGGSCNSGAGVISCQLDEIAGGSSTVIHLLLRSDVVGSNSVSVEVSADNESRTTNNRGEGTLSIDPEADLGVSLQAPSSIAIGSAFNVSLSATNLAVIATNGISITLELPDGVTASSATLNGGSCAVQSGAIVCSIASLAAGATVTGSASLNASVAGSALLRARISGSYVDPVASNDTAQTSVTVTTVMSTSAQPAKSGGGGSSELLLLSALLGLLGLKKLQRRPPDWR
jgi:hypothetical protein